MYRSIRSTKERSYLGALVLLLLFLSTQHGSAQIAYEPANTGFNRAQITCFAFTQDGSTLVGTVGGMYRLRAESDRWEPLSVNVNVHGIERTPTGTLLAGTSSGTLRSTDNGETWTNVYNVPGAASFCFPTDSLVLAADGVGTSTYHYISNDDGQTWQILEVPYKTSYGAGIVANSEGIIFYNSAEHIVRSTDYGKSWEATQLNSIPSPPTITTNDVVVTSIFGDGGRGILYESSDNGVTWTAVDTAVGRIKALKAGTDGSYYYILADTVFSYNLYQTIPSFQNGIYRRVPGQAGSERILSATTPTAMRFDGPTPWVGADYTPYTTNATPEQWTAVSNGLANVQVKRMITDGKNTLYVLTTDKMLDDVLLTSYALYRSTDLAESWSKVSTSAGATSFAVDGFGAVYATKDSGIWSESELGGWVATLHRQLMRSTNQGDTWEEIVDRPFTDIAWDTTSGTIAMGILDNILISRDRGNSWEKLTETAWQDSQSVRYAKRLAVLNDGTILFSAPSNFGDATQQDQRGIYRLTPNNLVEKVVDGLYAQDFITTNDGSLLAVANKLVDNAPTESGIYRSVDGGKNWTNIFETVRPPEDLAYVGGSTFLAYNQFDSYISTDNGITWVETRSQNGIKDYINVAILGDGGMMYGNSNSAFVQSADGGKTWKSSAVEGFQGLVFTPLISLSGYLFLGTREHGVNKSVDRVSSAPETVSVQANTEFSVTATPSANTNQLTLAFHLPARGDVAFELYDMLGNNIASIAQNTYEAGKHRVATPLPDVTTGAYLVVMKTSAGTASTIVQLR